jgi:DNA-directed RNA polymerase subunit H (RpoH/RPB5)
MDPEEAAMRRAHYMLRRNLDIDKSTLPKVHLDDPFVA